MKKLALILFLFVLPALAIADNLAFMGIPLTGTIDNFSAKLSKKGLKMSPYSKELPAGVRSFEGTFIGRDAAIYVYYDTKKRTVYRAKACITVQSEGLAESLFEEVKNMLCNKYITVVDDGTQGGYNSSRLIVHQEASETAMRIGPIDPYITTFDPFYTNSYILHIDYVDAEGINSNTNSMMEDL